MPVVPGDDVLVQSEEELMVWSIALFVLWITSSLLLASATKYLTIIRNDWQAYTNFALCLLFVGSLLYVVLV